MDKNASLRALGDQIKADIESGAAEEDPAKLSRFQVVSFADLKSHTYIYWFGFPAMAAPASVESQVPLDTLLPETAARSQLREGISALRVGAAAGGTRGCPPFFLILAPGVGKDGEEVKVLPLSSFSQLPEAEKLRAVFGFMDPSGIESAPGWPLRNLLVLLSLRFGLRVATVVCYRCRLRRIELERRGTAADKPTLSGDFDDTQSFALKLHFGEHTGKVVGWEANVRGKAGPRQMDLGALMDPSRLMEAAADLNLRLMRWRAIPSLDTQLLSSTKCLLLGAGTLGCGVARSLMGWGVRHVTFVDNGRVSYSNPTRQGLKFTAFKSLFIMMILGDVILLLCPPLICLFVSTGSPSLSLPTVLTGASPRQHAQQKRWSASSRVCKARESP